MFEENFMGFDGDFSRGRASDRRLPPPRDFGSSGGFQQSPDTNPFLKSYDKNVDTKTDVVGLCKKLNEMGISCDMSIWSRPGPIRVDPVDFGSSRRTLHEFPDVASHDYSARRAFLRNNTSSHGFSPAELSFLGLQDSVNPNRLREMMALNHHRDLLLDHMNRPIKRSPPCLKSLSLGNDAFHDGSLMFERNRVSRALPDIDDGPGSYYPHDTLRGFSLGNDPLMCGGRNNRASRALAAAMEAGSGPSLVRQGSYGQQHMMRSDLPMDLASMVNIYGSVSLMGKDQIGCRFLQKLVDEGLFVDALFLEVINHVSELSMDPFGNYLVQKLLEACDEEQRTMIVSALTSKPTELLKICLNNYGTRVVQKMIETVKTKQQIGMVKSGLKPGFLSLVKDLNGNHVIQTCLTTLGPNDTKFVLEAATKYCAEIATHRHGCCVLQCCVSNSVGEQRERLVNEISRNSLHLSQDPFGNYVVQYLIEQKVSAAKLLMQFRMHYAELATQKFSSHVMEKCLRIYPESRAEIVRELLSVQNFEHLLHDPFGNYVIQTALSVTKGPVRASLVEKVHRYGKLKFSPYCKKIFSKNILKK
ncbi:Pumilio RNA-binding repeat-containing protein [Hirschfeldia incana]|nr:Pumilio RNA-binding repeat-containing protein [Hirschfeldia incana]